MPPPTSNSDRRLIEPARRLWLAAASAAGGASSRPACPSWLRWPQRARRALGAPVEVDIGTLRPGELRTLEWRGKPVWLLRRTAAMLENLRRHDDLLSDPHSDRRDQQPDYARNELRSVRPDTAVLVAICTHLGCIPTFRPEPGAADIGASWPGGFYCPCHGSRFDLAGRVFKNVPAPSKPRGATASLHRGLDAAHRRVTRFTRHQEGST
jgi:ubiquinol-cytochrome c reductase iron-sulfur subunit